MKIQWLGHACFAITLADGRTVVTDPVDPKVGYPGPNIACDIVTISHQHFDHNAAHLLQGDPVVLDQEGRYSFGSMEITAVPSFHDDQKGQQRGPNLIFVLEAEGIRLCHLGDLGHLLEPEQMASLGRINLLMLPVGGYYTIDAAKAYDVVEQLRPNYVLPMHYKTDYINLPISPPEDFLTYFPGYLEGRELELTPTGLPSNLQVVMLGLNN